MTMSIGKYEIIEPLGQGTFGNTFLVRKDEKDFALKLFKNEMIRSKNDIKRIEREIDAIKKVNHPNVVKYVDDGFHTEGFNKFRFLVMEYTAGEPLSNFIEKNKRLTIAQTQRIGIQILEGLKAIHDNDLFHRDLKPDNIFITRLGDVRILDFGLVKLLDASTLTAMGVPMGTYAYMAPEQLLDSKNIDFRSDLYSFGAILFHMITGQIALEIHSLVEAPYKILNEVPPFASSINPAVSNKLDNIISTLLEKQIHRRSFTVDSLYNEFRNLEDRTLQVTSSDLTLRFLPRLLHNERSLVEEYNNMFGIDGIVFPANFFPKYSAVYNSIRESGRFTLIDPIVYRLAYSKFSNTQSLVNLPYVLSTFHKEKPEDFGNLATFQKRAKEVLDWQISQNPSVLVAPFHFYANENDPWVDIDTKVFHECRKYLNEIKDNRPVYAGISIQIESLTDDLSALRLVNKFTRTQADGYILMFDIKLDSFNRAHYYAFGRIISMLAELSKPIVLSRVNDFGLGLMGLGATSISSGIGFIEDFKESILIEDAQGFNVKPRYYIPQLLTSYNQSALKDVFEPAIGKELRCDCPYCQGSTDVNYLFTSRVTKGHYLWHKQKQVGILNEMQQEERIRWFLNKAESAKELAKLLKKATKSKYISYEHFNVWQEVINQLAQEKQQAFTATLKSVAPFK
ncbi:serine/threonine protein kinase [Bacillus sp. FJAT-29790]|uniref:serine/threonine protein kinase n=1 Tax=Bacillus sp. FJAT-29790 TaxID=1895002 RepID=UPI001C22DDF7|nr:serine/threonine-protein kinase [Bacillus sp. FJAT-29790]MBU8880626.1 serine/threonine protein kinase [Bacillus sp. FJAT-29790]